MDLTKINSTTLREMLKLSERKEVLLSELRKIEAQILSSLGGSALSNGEAKKATLKKTAKKTSSSTKEKKVRAERGSMKKDILAVLINAGPLGMKVPDIASKINAKTTNVHVWFSSTGKKLPEIERLGAGHFRIRQNS